VERPRVSRNPCITESRIHEGFVVRALEELANLIAKDSGFRYDKNPRRQLSLTVSRYRTGICHPRAWKAQRDVESRVRREICIADRRRETRIPRFEVTLHHYAWTILMHLWITGETSRASGRTASRFSVIFSDLRVGSLCEKQDAA